MRRSDLSREIPKLGVFQTFLGRLGLGYLGVKSKETPPK